jgi:hypothetical protein
MLGFTPRLWLLGATAAGLLFVIGAGCSEFGSSGRSVTALDHNNHPAFPINIGAHALSDCNTCHGEFDTFKQFNCVACHEHSQELTDPVHVRVADYAWTGTACYDCHPDGAATAVDHTQFFPIGQGTTHDGITCATCHLDPANRKNVDCISCHTHTAAQTDPIHNGIPGYAHTSPKCLECHPKGQVNGIDHTFFPIGTGTVHTGLSCASCHPDRAHRKATDCTSCHTHAAAETNAIHASIPNYAYTSPKCLECHPQSTIPGIDHTAFFPTQLGATHGGISCRQCHPDRANRQVLDCLTCHTATSTDPRHTTVGGYARNSSTCVRCHAESQVNLVSAHLPFSIRLGTKHYRTSCLTCHPVSRTDKPWAQDFTPFDCLSCHPKTKMDDTHSGEAGYRYISTTCANSGCHQNGRKP